MSTNSMKIADILRYSVKIEHESMLFYQGASEKAAEGSVKELLKALEQDEIRHEKRLAEILKKTEENAELEFDRESLDQLIQNRQIPENADEITVLNIALEREKHTRNFYGSVLTATNLDQNVIDLFNMLFDQESSHVKRISILADKYANENTDT